MKITIFDRCAFSDEYLEFFRNKDTGEYYIKDGKLVRGSVDL